LRPVSGRVRVYLPLVPSIEDVWDRFDVLFTIHRKPLQTVPNKGAIYERWGDRFRLYRRGVLVYEELDNAAFDYELPDIGVDEERRADLWGIGYYLSQLMDELDVRHKQTILRAQQRRAVEGRIVSNYVMDRNCRSDSWLTAFGSSVAVTQAEAKHFAAELDGKDITVVPEEWISWIRSMNIRTIEQILSRETLKGYTVLTPTHEQKLIVDGALRMLEWAGVRIPKDKIFMFRAGEGNLRGEYDPDTGKIYLAEGLFKGGIPEVAATLLHEYCHHVSKAPDYTREFADAILAGWMRLILRDYQGPMMVAAA